MLLNLMKDYIEKEVKYSLSVGVNYGSTEVLTGIELNICRDCNNAHNELTRYMLDNGICLTAIREADKKITEMVKNKRMTLDIFEIEQLNKDISIFLLQK